MRSAATAILLVSFCAGAAFAQITLNSTPTRVIGQDSATIDNLNPNLVEGREFDFPTAIALDTTRNPPLLYVSDTGNNRVLGFRNAASFSNGQAADLVIGQPDFMTTLAAGPATSRTTGLSSPTGLAVDGHGNLYVVDSANNRILRFPQPFSQTGGPPLPDIAIGQSSFATGGANQGGLSAATLSFTVASSSSSAGTALSAFLAFDSAGNLWVSDAGNNRVLRFNASALGSQANSGPLADIVLGQMNFASNSYSPPAGSNPLLSTSSFTTPNGIAFDAAGRLFVSESAPSQRSRVLMWAPPFYIGQPAAGLLGVDTNNPQPPTVSEFQLNASAGAVFPIANSTGGLTSIGVVDTLNNRVLVFPPVEQWTLGATYQAAVEVAGQSNFSSGTPYSGGTTANANGFAPPSAALFYGNELYAADTVDHRVIVMPQNGGAFGAATRVLGQDAMNLNAPNLVEGREFNLSGGDAGLAVDLSANPPHLYVADPGNNRILCYYDSRNINAGVKADLVIGQPDFQQTLVNYPSNNPLTPNASGLFNPLGLVVDSSGNLYVADTGNCQGAALPCPVFELRAGYSDRDAAAGDCAGRSRARPTQFYEHHHRCDAAHDGCAVWTGADQLSRPAGLRCGPQSGPLFSGYVFAVHFRYAGHHGLWTAKFQQQRGRLGQRAVKVPTSCLGGFRRPALCGRHRQQPDCHLGSCAHGCSGPAGGAISYHRVKQSAWCFRE